MRILAIDTTAHFGSIALLEDAIVLEEVLLHSPEGFGQILYGQIERLLKRHNWSVHQIDCFAAAAGPGSFTGVRIGLTAAKGLAEATGKKVAAVSNLRALAELGSAPLRATVMDARRGEIYGALYDANLAEVSPEVVAPLSTWLETLPDSVEFIFADSAPFLSALSGTRFELCTVVDGQRALAGAVGRVAARCGSMMDPAEADASYVRRSDAELLWKDPNQSSLRNT
jgi:tRNA threonylcarbamoyladenosine biosynthesis protein TsaB